jgi:hypothetical protein
MLSFSLRFPFSAAIIVPRHGQVRGKGTNIHSRP